jgi:signal transduction histidine kinase/DNA-binding response OmpR family regulator
MSETTQPAKQLREVFDDVAKLTAAVGLVIFERDPKGEFILLSPPPNWFRNLVANAQAGSVLPVVDVFPALDAFLPEAETLWNVAGRDTGPELSSEVISDLWSDVHSSGEELHFRARALRADGRNWLILELATSLYREGQLVLQYAHDLALQNDTILRLNLEVERATQAKSDFLATMSHEIRTPLNAILGMAELMSETQLTEEQQKYVGTFQRAGRALLKLINDILDLSKVESGNLKLESVNFDLFEMIESVVELVQAEGRAKGIAVKREIAPSTPRYLRGDALRLRQVLLNLMGNSLKFTHRGSVQLTVEHEPDVQSAAVLRFRIQDTGIGIAKDQVLNLFQTFTQADSSITRRYGGTGLGLTISKKLVEAMGGRIWVESTPGEGSTFSFTVRVEIGQAPDAVQPAIGQGQSRAVRACYRILLADDSEDSRFMISSYLKSLPYSLEFAENGAIAAEKLRTGAYDLALIDVHMPEMDGYDVARSVRNAESGGVTHPIPLIALTADAYASAIEKSIAAGFNAHLTKPIGKQTLLEAIAHYARTPERHEAKGMDESGVASLAGEYLKSSRKKAAEIAIASASENFDAIRADAHNMKGTGTAYGFPRLTELGGILEKSALEKDAGAIRKAIHHLFEYLDLLAHEQEAMQETVTVNAPHVRVTSSLRSLVPEFIASLRTGSVGLKDAIQNSDFSAVRVFGHDLKGNGANYRFPILTELGDRLESAAMRNESETVSAIIDELRRYLDSVVIEYE